MRRLAAAVVALLIAAPAAQAAPTGTQGARWQPSAGETFQWQLQGTVDTSVEADVYDIDMFDSPASLVTELHEMGRHVVCYVSAGSYENWRPDKRRFPKKILGKPLDGWAGERWLDVRKLKPLKRIMDARLAKCAAKGFDGVEYDNVDGFTNRTGFPLTKKHQLAYLRYLSSAAHEHGLAAGLKNLPQLARKLEPRWDFVVNEQCFQYDECEPYLSFIDAGKPVFNVEYELELDEFCDQANAWGFTSMRKRYNLKAERWACWER